MGLGWGRAWSSGNNILRTEKSWIYVKQKSLLKQIIFYEFLLHCTGTFLMIMDDYNLERDTVHFPQSQKYNDHGLKTSNFRDRSLIQNRKYFLMRCIFTLYYCNFSSQNYVRKKDKLKMWCVKVGYLFVDPYYNFIKMRDILTSCFCPLHYYVESLTYRYFVGK